MTLLTLEGVVASRGGLGVLHGLDLEVRRGEFCIVIGPNGAGKSTMVECVSGMLRPDSGRVLLCGRDVTAAGIAERVRGGLGVVPEGRKLFAGMTARENLRIAAHVWGIGRHELERRTEELIERFPALSPKLDVLAGRLSGGQQQLLAVVRALLAEPRVLVLDEPSFGLAPAIWTEVIEHCRTLADEGRGVLLVEQRVLQVLPRADRVMVLQRGRLMEIDRGGGALDADELVRHYFSGQEPA